MLYDFSRAIRQWEKSVVDNAPAIKFREVEVKQPDFNNIEDWYAYKKARSDGAKYLSNVLSDLKGNKP